MVAPVPPVRVMGSAYLDSDAIEQAVRSAQDAVQRLDLDAIRQQARDAAQQARDIAHSAGTAASRRTSSWLCLR
jgi:hypothetical protein